VRLLAAYRPIAVLALALGLGATLVGCPQHAPPRAAVVAAPGTQGAARAPDDAAPYPVRLDHLRRLGLDATVRGHHVRVVALYAQAPEYRPVASPLRDGSEGIACVDDAARAAVVYLRELEASGDPRLLDDARGLLDFVVAMEEGDGEFVNFIHADGSPNVVAPSSKKSFSYWAARAVWALGEAVRVLAKRAPDVVAAYRPVLDRAVARLARDVDAAKLPGGSSVAASEALLGLLAYQVAEPTPKKAALAESAALLLACARSGEAPCKSLDELASHIEHADLGRAPWGGRSEAPPWHAWGARATEALARAGLVLHRPVLTSAARQEADALWTRMLLANQFPAEIAADGAVRAYPQIAYGLSPIVGGFLALADATSDPRYAMLGGLAAAWFFGANPAGIPMYDVATGRTFDGLDGPGAVNRNSGGESTVEALLALGPLAHRPAAARYTRYRPVGAPASITVPGLRRELADGASRRVRLVGGVAGEPPILFKTVRVEEER
jgi:hypothetical protein